VWGLGVGIGLAVGQFEL